MAQDPNPPLNNQEQEKPSKVNFTNFIQGKMENLNYLQQYQEGYIDGVHEAYQVILKAKDKEIEELRASDTMHSDLVDKYSFRVEQLEEIVKELRVLHPEPVE